MFFLKLQQEAWSSSRVVMVPQGTSCVSSVKEGLLSSCEGHLMIALESLLENRASSPVEAGNLGLLSSCNSDLGVLIDFQQGSQAWSLLEAWNLTFLSSCKRSVRPPVEFRQELGLFLEVQQGCQTSLHVLRGYSGFHLSQCSGISSYFELKGNSVSFQLSSCTAPLEFQR